MHKTKTFMVAIMLALALTLPTVGMTTLTQHALAAPWDLCYHPCYAYNQQPTYTQIFAQDCTRYDSNCWNSGFDQQQSTYHNVDYGGIWVTPSGFSCWGEWRCASGWNHAIEDAANDFTSGVTIAQSSCPDGHTYQYCNGYTQGYVYAWNLDVQARYQSQGPPQAQTQQCASTVVNSPGAYVQCSQSEQSNP